MKKGNILFNQVLDMQFFTFKVFDPRMQLEKAENFMYSFF